MFKKHCCTWEVAFHKPLTTLPPLCMPIKPGHRPLEVSAAFIWSLSFDRVLVAVWSLLEARKQLCSLSGSGRCEVACGVFVLIFTPSKFWQPCKQTFDQILCISVQCAFFGAFYFKLSFTGVMVRKALSENMPFLTMLLTVLLVSAYTTQVHERWEGSISTRFMLVAQIHPGDTPCFI